MQVSLPHLPALSLPFIAVLGVSAFTPTSAMPQDGVTTDADVIEMARERQADFERLREARTPVEPVGQGQTCDERIGRICIWFGGEGEGRYPRELDEVNDARIQLIGLLSEANQRVHDPWILGQLVNYLAEARRLDEAERVAEACGIAEEWWCSALTGYVLHLRSEHVDSEAAFREALALMPPDELGRWTGMRYVLTDDGRAALEGADPGERLARWELFWRLSDPLFLIEGNDRLTDHFARWVEATNRRDAAHPQAMEWDEDLEATLIRYGRILGYSRSYDPQNTFSGGRLQDTRRMIGHHHPFSRGYLFPEGFIESPSDIPPESWITVPREARTWYAPPYAPEIRGLETQIARFRFDDGMMVVGAYRPSVPDEETGEMAPWSRPANASGPLYAAFFLVPLDGSEMEFVRGDDVEGVFTIHAWPGRYVSGLEVVDMEGRQAWRARQGVVQEALAPGLVDVSDLLLLKPGAPLPETLDEAIQQARPGVRISRGERFAVAWEVYGLRIQEPVQVTLGFTRGHPGFLSRVGEFLGILEPEQPVEVTFEDTGPDVVQSAFRSIELELPALEPGEYTLHLRLDLSGRTPVVTSRPIVVE